MAGDSAYRDESHFLAGAVMVFCGGFNSNGDLVSAGSPCWGAGKETCDFRALPSYEAPALRGVYLELALPVGERGKKLVTSGPYRLMRHPLYAAFIWSGTGAAAVWLQSWLLIFSVIPIHIFWVWHIRNEELFMLEQFGAEYKVYMETTGQFFPILRRDKK